jgi:hypothetical protein
VVTISHTNFKQREVLMLRDLDPATNETDRTGHSVQLDLPAHKDRKVVIQFMMPPDSGGEILCGRIAGVRFE